MAKLRCKIELARKFGEVLDGKPMPSWGTNAKYRFDQTVATIKDAAKQCFAKKDIAPTQPFISLDTMCLI